jgi:DNA-directed RNA polymerase specialized sigma24 family protein
MWDVGIGGIRNRERRGGIGRRLGSPGSSPGRGRRADWTRKEFVELVALVLSELPTRERSIVALWIDEELPLPEIARSTGIPLRSTERSLSRALSHIRLRLRELGVAGNAQTSREKEPSDG